MFVVIFFFFKQKTAYEMRISDWSSDVCSSDLHALGHEGGLAEQAERDQDESGQGGQLELDQRHEKLDRENEEGEDDQRPGEQEAGDLDEVLEERPVAHQVGDGVEQRTARVEAGLSDLAGAHQVDRKRVVQGKSVSVRV